MEPRQVDYPDYVKLYQSKYQELFNQFISAEAKLLVATEYATDLKEVIIQLQEENASLKSQLNKKATPKRKAVANEDSFVDAEGI